MTAWEAHESTSAAIAKERLQFIIAKDNDCVVYGHIEEHGTWSCFVFDRPINILPGEAMVWFYNSETNQQGAYTIKVHPDDYRRS